MKFKTCFFLLLGFCALIGFGMAVQDRGVHAAPAPQVIGTYPDLPHIAAMKASADSIAIRAHAWAILSHFTQAGTSANPEWEGGPGWEGKCGRLNLGNSNCPTSPDSKQLLIETPPQTRDPRDPLSPTPKPPFTVSSVLYNKAAADFIATNGLATKTPWQALNQKDYTLADQQLTFPTGAVVVKEIWENVSICTPTTGNSPLTQESCPATISVWDPKMVTNIASPPNVQYPSVNEWFNALLPIDTDINRPCDPNQKYVYYPRNAHPAPAIPPKSEWTPLKCFHFLKNTPDGNTTAWPGRATVVPGNGNTVGNGPIPGHASYLVLVGFHVMTAELPGWTWNTFWWTRPDVNTGKRDDHPDAIRTHLPWSLYSMDTTLDDTTPRESNGAAKVVFNPYLEGHQLNGAVSNCIACHSRAVYRDQPEGYLAKDMTHLLKPQCLLMPSPGPNCPTTGFLSNDQYFRTDKGVRTHFLWSLAIKQDADALGRFNNVMTRPLQ